jgi:hypothetical protein
LSSSTVGPSAFSGRYDIDRLAPFFEAAGHEVVQFDYGFRLIVSNRNEKWSRKLRDVTQFGDVLVGHSNGACLIQQASWEDYGGALRTKAILLNPVCESKARFGPSLDAIHVFYTPTDPAVGIARLLPWHPWGSAGNVGIRTGDPRVTNHDMSKDYPVKVWDHLGLFHQPPSTSTGHCLRGCDVRDS